MAEDIKIMRGRRNQTYFEWVKKNSEEFEQTNTKNEFKGSKSMGRNLTFTEN